MPASVVQSSHGIGNRSLAGIVAGHLLVAMESCRSSSPVTPTGYTKSAQGDVQNGNDRALAYYKIASGSETTLVATNNQGVCWYEVGGAPSGTVRANVSATGTGTVASTAGVSVVEGDIAFLICTIGSGGAFDAGANNNKWTPGGSWIEDHDSMVFDGHPSTFIAHQVIAADGTLAGSATFTNGSYVWAAQLIVFVGTNTPPEPGPQLGVYDPDDVFLSDLTEAFDIQVRIEHNGVGTGKFSINRNSTEATVAILTPGNYVRVTVPQIDSDPLFGFFLEAGNFDLVSSDEEGGETISFEGRGSLSYWDRAIWLAESFFTPWWPTYLTVPPATPPGTAIGALAFPKGWYYHWGVSGTTATTRTKFYTNGFTAYYNTRKRYTRSGLPTLTLCHLSTGVYSGYYVNPFTPKVRDYRKKNPYTLGPSVLMSSISTAKRPGEILYAMYQESQSADRPDAPLPAMTIDFTATLDSDGNAWTVTDALNGVSSELGDDYLSTIGKLVNTGSVDVVMGPDLDMHAYNAYGRDLHSSTFASGKVRFAKGVNIADQLTREYTDQPVGTFAEVIGNEEGAIARVFLPSAGSRPAREISVRGETADLDALEALGLSELAARLLHSDAIGFAVATPTIGNEDDTVGLYLPGPPGSSRGDYWVGDLVTLHTGSGEHDFNETTVRVAAITLSFSDANDLRVVAEVGSGFGGMPQISASSTSSTAPSSGTSVSTLSDLYQLISERDQLGGYPSLDDDGLIDPTQLAVQWKQSVRVATTGAGTLASSFEAGDTIDGVTLAEGDDILIKDQASALANGIYSVEASGAPTRRSDMDADIDVVGTIVLVREGTANGGTVWRATNTTDPVIGTNAINFDPFAAPGSILAEDLATAETDTSFVLSPDGSGGVEFRAESGSGVAEDLTTAETDTTLVLAPDGAGGVEFRAESGGTSNVHNENEAAVLVNATSTGDAGSRADHFAGTSLNAAWVGEANALALGPTVKYSAVGMRHTANNAHHRLRAYTPSGAFRIEARLRYYLTSGQGGAGVLVRDSGTGDASGNGFLAWMSNVGRFEAYSLDTGTYTQRGTTLAETLGLAGPFVYIAIERDGSNNWKAELSLDRALWIPGVTGHSKTFTVAKVGFRLFGGVGATLLSVDFFDIVS